MVEEDPTTTDRPSAIFNALVLLSNPIDVVLDRCRAARVDAETQKLGLLRRPQQIPKIDQPASYQPTPIPAHSPIQATPTHPNPAPLRYRSLGQVQLCTQEECVAARATIFGIVEQENTTGGTSEGTLDDRARSVQTLPITRTGRELP